MQAQGVFMKRIRTGVGALLAMIVAVGAELGAQDAGAAQRRIGVGLDYGASQDVGALYGNWIGPTLDVRLAGRGALSLGVDASLQVRADPVPSPNTNSTGVWRGPSVRDDRPLRGLALATIAVELGTRDRAPSGGPFVAARVGGGAGVLGPGDVLYQPSPWREFTYHQRGAAIALLTAGGEVGLWLPAFGGTNRLSLRIDGVHGERVSGSRLSVVLRRY
jgi:hypothetical protein